MRRMFRHTARKLGVSAEEKADGEEKMLEMKRPKATVSMEASAKYTQEMKGMEMTFRLTATMTEATLEVKRGGEANMISSTSITQHQKKKVMK